jgi:hypothetical protein
LVIWPDQIAEFVEVVNIGLVGEFDTELGKEVVDAAGLEEVKMDEADVEGRVGKSTTPVPYTD